MEYLNCGFKIGLILSKGLMAFKKIAVFRELIYQVPQIAEF